VAQTPKTSTKSSIRAATAHMQVPVPALGTGLLRLPQVLSIFPVGKTTWWAGVKSGRYPPPVKISARCTAWRSIEIQQVIDGEWRAGA